MRGISEVSAIKEKTIFIRDHKREHEEPARSAVTQVPLPRTAITRTRRLFDEAKRLLRGCLLRLFLHLLQALQVLLRSLVVVRLGIAGWSRINRTWAKGFR